MHIPDGLLPPEVTIAGYAVTGALTWVALRKINQLDDPEAHVPRAALMTSAFFVASWIHIPVPPTSVHLLLNGLLGVMLGWFAMPAIVVGLFLQAVMFQHGGLTTLGVNATMMGIPALLAYQIFRLRFRFSDDNNRLTSIFAFAGGAFGLGLAALIAFVILIATIPPYLDVQAERTAILALTLAHVPLMIIEGLLTALIISFFLQVQPDMVEAHAPSAG